MTTTITASLPPLPRTPEPLPAVSAEVQALIDQAVARDRADRAREDGRVMVSRDSLRALTRSAKKWADELGEYIIPSADADDRASYIAEHGRTERALEDIAFELGIS